MPSTFERVTVPENLLRKHEEPPASNEPEPSGDFWRSLFTLLLMFIGAVTMGAGVAWWVHPGAGVAIMGLAIFVIAVLTETNK